MPGLAHINDHQHQFGIGSTDMFHTLSRANGSVAANGFWSKHRGDVSFKQLQKFWAELSPQARQKLLRIDKQTLFEQARKNMYCSRCNGLLLEGFLQIVMYGKSLQHESSDGRLSSFGLGASKGQNDADLFITNGCQDDVQDPSVHPWGGLTTARDGTLTLLDCYLYAKSLKVLQDVFDSARARERERELLYPDACGGGVRGWISQGMPGYGRGHGTRETCALHTARLSVDTLVDFWLALGEETHQSLLRMKEEDFIERLMFRFDSKRFCRDCRRNVIREFKELKELKRMRREHRCTNWFCVADTAFQYEVSLDTIQADWHQTFVDTYRTYHYFEWAVGTEEGKADILEFENVGLSRKVEVNGLDLSGLNECYITLRGWKMDGRCTEHSVKAHALKGQQCVHCRLVVGDGFVTITKGESIRRFFEHAEEDEEEEDDDFMDKDGNERDGECSRPQKHAKSPELAREFLLDAATVIFKDQVEKAFREGTARQNAHSILVCLAQKLLEERIHVACKEIITLEKQMKLLEEEEKEKREEEERKERKRTKEREKKLRRKERLREKEKDREKCFESNKNPVVTDGYKEESTPNIDDNLNATDNGDAISVIGEAIPSGTSSPEVQEQQHLNGYICSSMPNVSNDSPGGELVNTKDGNGPFAIDNPKNYRRKLKFQKKFQQEVTLKWPERRQYAVVSENGGTLSKSQPRHNCDNFEFSFQSINGLNKPLRMNAAKPDIRNSGPKFGDKFHCPNSRMSDSHDLHSCSCKQHKDYRAKGEPHFSVARAISKSQSVSDISRSYHRGNRYIQAEYMRESCRRTTPTQKVWEPMESQKKYQQINSDTDVTLRSTSLKLESTEPGKLESSEAKSFKDVHRDFVKPIHEDHDLVVSCNARTEMGKNSRMASKLELKSYESPKEVVDEEANLCPRTISSLNGTADSSLSSSSLSDNCSSCLSEGGSNTSSLSNQNPESLFTSDSENASQHSDGRDELLCPQSGLCECREVGLEQKQSTEGNDARRSWTLDIGGHNAIENLHPKMVQNYDYGKMNICMGSQPQGVVPSLHNQGVHFPLFQPRTVGYYQQTPVTWPATSGNGLMSFPRANHYVFADGPFGYGLNGNSHMVQYSAAVQQLTPPLLNQVPNFQPSGVNSKELAAKISNISGVKEAGHESNFQRVVPIAQHQTDAQATAEVGQNGCSDKSPMGNTGFSLFHFGGPVALSTEYKTNHVPSSKGGVGGEFSSNLSADQFVEGDDDACSKSDIVEEYNLFAATNGLRFSFI